jgi:hypothetical protein
VTLQLKGLFLPCGSNQIPLNQAIANARRTHRVIVKSLPKVQPGEKERQRIEGKLKELEQALEQLPKLRKVR